MIPPPAQRFMSQRAGSTVVEAGASHSIYMSQPGATTAIIERRDGSSGGAGSAARCPPDRRVSDRCAADWRQVPPLDTRHGDAVNKKPYRVEVYTEVRK